MIRKVTKIIIHCSDSDIENITALDVNRWHQEKGWSGIGYHWFIRKNGMIEKGRDESKMGAHCRGENDDSLGICMHGRKYFNDVQLTSLKRIVRERCKLYKIPADQIFPHNHFNQNKTCPNFDIEFLREYIRGEQNGKSETGSGSIERTL